MADRFHNRSMNRNNVAVPSPRANNQNNPSTNNGCSSCQGNCRTLMKRLQALDFSITDTGLYLNAYPNSSEALAYYNKLLAERDALKRSLAESCHMPVTHMDNASTDTWHWIMGPWPWEADAN